MFHGSIDGFGVLVDFAEVKGRPEATLARVSYFIEGSEYSDGNYYEVGDLLQSMLWVHKDCGHREIDAKKTPDDNEIEIFELIEGAVCRGEDCDERAAIMGLNLYSPARFNLSFHPSIGNGLTILYAYGATGVVARRIGKGRPGIVFVKGRIKDMDDALAAAFGDLNRRASQMKGLSSED